MGDFVGNIRRNFFNAIYNGCDKSLKYLNLKENSMFLYSKTSEITEIHRKSLKNIEKHLNVLKNIENHLNV